MGNAAAEQLRHLLRQPPKENRKAHRLWRLHADSRTCRALSVVGNWEQWEAIAGNGKQLGAETGRTMESNGKQREAMRSNRRQWRKAKTKLEGYDGVKKFDLRNPQFAVLLAHLARLVHRFAGSQFVGRPVRWRFARFAGSPVCRLARCFIGLPVRRFVASPACYVRTLFRQFSKSQAYWFARNSLVRWLASTLITWFGRWAGWPMRLVRRFVGSSALPSSPTPRFPWFARFASLLIPHVLWFARIVGSQGHQVTGSPFHWFASVPIRRFA